MTFSFSSSIRMFGLVASLFAMLLLSGCAGSKQLGAGVRTDGREMATPDTERQSIIGDGSVGKLDILRVAVFQLPEYAQDVQVDTNGEIMLPLIGTIKADGRQASEIAEEIRGRLATNYVRRPDVTVAIKEAVEKVVTVEGSVRKPGVYPIRGRISLLQAISLAEGMGEFANPKRVVVFRQIDGARNAAVFDVSAIRMAQADDPIVYGNDIVVVDGSGLKRGFRDFLQAVPLIAVFTRV